MSETSIPKTAIQLMVDIFNRTPGNSGATTNNFSVVGVPTAIADEEDFNTSLFVNVGRVKNYEVFYTRIGLSEIGVEDLEIPAVDYADELIDAEYISAFLLENLGVHLPPGDFTLSDDELHLTVAVSDTHLVYTGELAIAVGPSV